MKIEYSITKNRGNWRPVLVYNCIKEAWEYELAIPGGKTAITIEAVCPYFSSDERRALPGRAERGEGWNPVMVALALPDSQSTVRDEAIILPWRPGAHPEYPEVHQAMADLRDEWERRVYEAMQSGDIAQQWVILPSDAYRERTEGYAVAVTLTHTKT